MSEGEDLDLPELLRRCHLSELQNLASKLRIQSRGLGRDALARHLAASARRLGGHGLLNLVLRRGEGPAWAQVLEDLLVRCSVAPPTGVAAREQALVRWALRRTWAELTGPERDALWGQLRQLPPAPGDDAPAVLEQKVGARFGYAASGALLLVGGRLLPPLGGCASLWWLLQPDDRRLLPVALEVARLRQVVRHRVTVGVVGSPSSGKDAAIKAIFGVDSGNVDPVAGSTRTVEITRLQGSTALFVVNTPGLGDVDEAVTAEAREVLEHIDVYLYLVNAQGGVQAREKADYSELVRRGRPVLAVVNKIDTLRPSDRERFLADARAKLGQPDFLAAAFDPLPALSEAPLGVGEVQAWIEERLVQLGKDRSELPWRR